MNEKLPQPWTPGTPAAPPQQAETAGAGSAGPGVPSFDDDPTFGDVLIVVRRHWRLVGAITLLVTALTAWVVYTTVPRYRAHAALRLQDERRMMTGGLETSALESVMGRQTDPLLSEMQVLRSRAVMGEVVEREGLRLAVLQGAFRRRYVTDITVTSDVVDTVHVRYFDDRYEARSSRGSAGARYGEPVVVAGVGFTVRARPDPADDAMLLVMTNDVAIDNLTAGLQARQRERTNVFDLEFVSPDPLLAQQVVNATAEVFRQRNLEAAQQQSRRRRDFVEARLAETELTLAQAQRALSEFQMREQLFSSREKSAAQQVTLHTLEIRRDELIAERAMFARLLARMNRDGGRNNADVRTVVSSPGIAQNPVISQLYTQLVRYEVVRDSMRAAGASATNPDLVAVTNLIDGAEASLLGALESHIAALDGRISAAEDMSRRHAAELAAMPQAQAEEAVLLLEVQTIQRMADLLREEAQRARISEAVEAGQVEIVDLASFPSRPINDRKGLKLAIGFFIGLLLGGAGALLREQLNTSIRAREDVERHLNLTPLTVVPQFGHDGRSSRLGLGRLRSGRTNGAALTKAGAADSRLVTLTDTHSPASEAFRKLRTGLIFSQSTYKLTRLVVTSSAAAEGKSTTAANLAISFAQQGMRVLLVDGDLRRPSLHDVFDLAKEPGLTELILERTSMEDAVRHTKVPNLSVLPSGIQPPNPAEMIAGPRMRALVAQLESQFELIIFDSPPVLAASEGPVLSVRSDGVVVVVRAGQTDRRSIQLAVHQLRSVGANIIGVVLNDVDGKVPKYGYYDAYYYTYYGKDELVGTGESS